MLSRIANLKHTLAENAERHQRSFTTRTFTRVVHRGGPTHAAHIASTGPAVVYKSGTPDKTLEARSISAHIIHGSHPDGGLEDGATEHFTERRTYGVHRSKQRLMPAWERMAHGLIIIARRQPRVFPEFAFRTMALFLRMLMVTRVAETKMLLLPGQAAHNLEGLVAAAKAEAEAKGLAKQDSSAPAAVDATPATPADNGAPKA